MPCKATHEVKLQEFQCKIIHSILPSRCSLFRAKLSECDTCRVCHSASETLPHLLFGCPTVYAFWQAFQNWWLEKTRQAFDLTERNVIYGWYDNARKTDQLNYVAIVAKYYIFCCFQDNGLVSFDSFSPFLSIRIDTLKQISIKNKRHEEFKYEWKNFF